MVTLLSGSHLLISSPYGWNISPLYLLAQLQQQVSQRTVRACQRYLQHLTFPNTFIQE